LQIKLGRELAKGEFALHKCDNPKCNNPDHLYVGTQKENVRDMMDRKRAGGQFVSGQKHAPETQARGTRIYSATINEDLVRKIRAMYVPKHFGYKRVAKILGTKIFYMPLFGKFF
jgi:hypothetical protein